MHFNYTNGKPFILFVKYSKEAMQNLSVSSTPIDARSSTVWHHGLTSKGPYWYQWKDRAWMSDTCIVGEAPDDSPGVSQPQIQ